MKSKINDILQWIGAIFIIIGHVLNAIGPSVYPYNIIAFTLGTVFFLTWTLRVKNKPQMIVNVVAIITCFTGLAKAFIG
jgi:hypothetical protein